MRIIYAGDSTVAFNKFDTYPQTGISQGLLLYVKDDVFLRSFARNGRSTKSFIDEGRLQLIDDYLAKGDLFLIQFGHNDEKAVDPLRYAEPYGAYQYNLKTMADVAKARQSLPVLITPVARRYFDKDGRFVAGSHGEYPNAMKELARAEGIPCIDLNAMSEQYLDSIGDVASRPMYVYPKDNTHLSYQGAVIFAGMVAKGLRDLGKPYADCLI